MNRMNIVASKIVVVCFRIALDYYYSFSIRGVVVRFLIALHIHGMLDVSSFLAFYNEKAKPLNLIEGRKKNQCTASNERKENKQTNDKAKTHTHTHTISTVEFAQ